MRLFVGIRLGADMEKEVIQFIDRAKINHPSFKWTSPENLHFTLKFFGETPASRLTEINEALYQAAAQNERFELRLGKIGCFPARGTPRVIWIGVSVGDKQLIKLGNSIDTVCFRHGFPREDRPFNPHLTIARIKNKSADFKFREPDCQFCSKSMIEEFFLIESQLYRTGPVYRKIEKFPLQIKNS